MDRQADVAQQFWGATRDWEARPEDEPADDMWAERTGSMRAIREGFTSFKPRRGEPTRSRVGGRVGGMDRTRSHGIVRPSADDAPTGQIRRVDPEASLADLAAGRRAQLELDWPDEDDWSLPDSLHTGATARIDSARVEAVSGPVRSTRRRSHGGPTGRLAAVPPPNPTQRRREYDDDAGLIPLSTTVPLAQRLGLGAVDPLLLRLGALLLVGVLAVPLAFAGRDRADDSLATAELAAAAAAPAVDPAAAAAPPQTAAPLPAVAAGAAPAGEAPAADAAPADTSNNSSQVNDTASDPQPDSSNDSSRASDVGGDDGDDEAAVTAQSVDDVQDAAVAATNPPEVAVATEDAERVEPVCALVYTVAPGDSWYRIADEAGVSMQSVLDANLAGVESVILPGDEICLPEGATIPSPPTTAPTTTQAPATTVAPTTTRPPTTTTPPPAPASTGDVQGLIREIWPDDLEERALQIAWRESNYVATAYNGICCYGVFQMHWVAHRSWLDDYGILSTSDLLDARKNITAAYALYQRAGGWAPWGG